MKGGRGPALHEWLFLNRVTFSGQLTGCGKNCSKKWDLAFFKDLAHKELGGHSGPPAGEMNFSSFCVLTVVGKEW